jgi:hydrogenase expression/formation protein HypE
LATSLVEISIQSGVSIVIDEDAIPVHPSVRAACEILGFDPLYIANEGKLIAVVSSNCAKDVLSRMHNLPLGENAAIIGEIQETSPGRVLMRTSIGTTRVVDMLAGELLPRIC